MENTPILVMGKTSKTGARVNQRLQAMGYATRAISRSTTPSFDWNEPATWRAAIAGTRSAYVAYQPDLAIPRAEATIKQFIEIARDAGLEHLVLLSGRGEEGAQRAEKILQESGLAWNIVRCSWFFQNFSESFMAEGILAGELVLPAADTLEPFLDADDIADVIVATLTDSRHRNKLYELTGPHAMSFAECVEGIAEALGRPIAYTPIAIDDYIMALQQQGVDEDMQWLLRELFTKVFDGRNTPLTTGVEEVLGRQAGDFHSYLRKTIPSGVWGSVVHKATA